MTPGQQWALWAIGLMVVALLAACAIGSLAGWWAGPRLRRRDARRELSAQTPFSPDTEQAIFDALANVEHVEDNPAAEYAVAALRRDLDQWGQP